MVRPHNEELAIVERLDWSGTGTFEQNSRLSLDFVSH